MLAAAFASARPPQPLELTDVIAAPPIFDATADFEGPSQFRNAAAARPTLPCCASPPAFWQAASLAGSTAPWPVLVVVGALVVVVVAVVVAVVVGPEVGAPLPGVDGPVRFVEGTLTTALGPLLGTSVEVGVPE